MVGRSRINGERRLATSRGHDKHQGAHCSRLACSGKQAAFRQESPGASGASSISPSTSSRDTTATGPDNTRELSLSFCARNHLALPHRSCARRWYRPAPPSRPRQRREQAASDHTKRRGALGAAAIARRLAGDIPAPPPRAASASASPAARRYGDRSGHRPRAAPVAAAPKSRDAEGELQLDGVGVQRLDLHRGRGRRHDVLLLSSTVRMTSEIVRRRHSRQPRGRCSLTAVVAVGAAEVGELSLGQAAVGQHDEIVRGVEQVRRPPVGLRPRGPRCRRSARSSRRPRRPC